MDKSKITVRMVDEYLAECLALASGCAEYSLFTKHETFFQVVADTLELLVDFVENMPGIRWDAPFEQEMHRIHEEMRK